MPGRVIVPYALATFAAVTASLQQPAPAPAPVQSAGEKYSSVRVLRDIPADQMIPTMAFIANSLGVTCAHCHAADWASDENPNKQKAREMMRLTSAVNERQYGGRLVVTCQTCHGGRAVPRSIPDVDEAGWKKRPQPAVEAPLPPASDVMAAYVRGVGPEAVLKRLTNRVSAGTITRFNGRTEPASGRFTLFQEATSARLSTGLSHPPEADVEIKASFARPLSMASIYTGVKVVGRDRIGDKETIVVEGTTARATVHRLWFDRRSGLLLRRADDLATPLGLLPERYDFEEYRKVDGVMVPHVVRWSRADYEVTFAVDSVRHNVSAPK